MELRFDVVIRARFMWILLGSKKDVCTVMTTDQGMYVIQTGRYGAVAEIDVGLGGIPGAALSAAVSSDKKRYAKRVQENQAKITKNNLDELARQGSNMFIPFEELVSVSLGGPKPERLEQSRRFDPATGPTLEIKTTKRKFKLVFCRHTYEEVDPLVQLLQSHTQ